MCATSLPFFLGFNQRQREPARSYFQFRGQRGKGHRSQQAAKTVERIDIDLLTVGESPTMFGTVNFVRHAARLWAALAFFLSGEYFLALAAPMVAQAFSEQEDSLLKILGVGPCGASNVAKLDSLHLPS